METFFKRKKANNQMENYCRISTVVGKTNSRKWKAILSLWGLKGKCPSLLLYFSPSSFLILCCEFCKWWRAMTANPLVHKINFSLNFLRLRQASLMQKLVSVHFLKWAKEKNFKKWSVLCLGCNHALYGFYKETPVSLERHLLILFLKEHFALNDW